MIEIREMDSKKWEVHLSIVQGFLSSKRTPLSPFEKRHFARSISGRKFYLENVRTNEAMVGGTIVRHGYKNTGEFLYINKRVVCIVFANYSIQNKQVQWKLNRVVQLPKSRDFGNSFISKCICRFLRFCSEEGFRASELASCAIYEARKPNLSEKVPLYKVPEFLNEFSRKQKGIYAKTGRTKNDLSSAIKLLRWEVGIIGEYCKILNIPLEKDVEEAIYQN